MIKATPKDKYGNRFITGKIPIRILLDEDDPDEMDEQTAKGLFEEKLANYAESNSGSEFLANSEVILDK